jgi:hypothetical protein
LLQYSAKRRAKSSASTFVLTALTLGRFAGFRSGGPTRFRACPAPTNR